jgi:hypothetical protein
MLYIFVFNLGYGAMVYITVIEILPAHVRELCNRWAGLLPPFRDLFPHRAGICGLKLNPGI